MNLSAIFISLFALVAISQAMPAQQDPRGIGNVVGGVFTDIYNKYAKQLSVLKDMAIMIKDGKSPGQIIKESIHKYPECIKNFTLITAACDLPTFQTIDYVGTACKYIDAKANQFVDFIDGYKPQTGAIIDKLDAHIQANANKPKTH